METYAMCQLYINFNPHHFLKFINLLLKETFQIKIIKKKHLISKFHL